MNFLSLFLRGIALLPSLIQGIETLYGAKSGNEKRDAAVRIVGSAIQIGDAVEGKKVVDATGFTTGLGQIVDGVVTCLNASIWAKNPQ